MKVVVGQKILNLEELFTIASAAGRQGVSAEVTVDSQIYAELGKQQQDKPSGPNFADMNEGIKLPQQEGRAVLAVKLIQLLKMKGMAQQATADALVAMLNENKVSDKDSGFFESLYKNFEERGVFPNEKEKFILNSLPHIGLCQNALVAYQCREGFGFLNCVLALSMETAEFPVDFFSDYTLSQRGRTTQGVVLFKN